MGGQHDVGAGDRVPVARQRSRIVAERIDGGVLEDHPAAVGDGSGEAGEVPARMDSRLTVEADPGAIGKRDRLEKRGVESQFRGEPGLVAQPVPRLLVGGLRHRRVQVARHPGEVTVELEIGGDRFDLSNRRKPGVPRRLGVIAAKSFDQRRQALISHHREMRCGVTGIDLGAALSLEQCDATAVEGQQIGSGQSRDAATDHDHVHLFIVVELGESWQRRGICPVWLGGKRRLGVHTLTCSKRVAKMDAPECHAFESTLLSGWDAIPPPATFDFRP